VSVNSLRPGDRIGRDVYTHHNMPPMLRRGAVISEAFRQSLERAGVTSVWIEDDLSEGIEPLEALSEQTRDAAIAAIRTLFVEVEGQHGTGTLSDRSVEEIQDIAGRVVADILSNAHCALALNDLAIADGYTMRHSLAVAVMGLALGLRVIQKYGWVDFRGARQYGELDERLTMLGVGLLLHDIGKLVIPLEVLHKPGRLTPEEFLMVQAHPETGYQMLKGGGVSAVSRAVVRSHHEKWDGTGYPDGKAGAAIHQFARVASVADVFDALTSDRSYRKGLPPHAGYEYILSRVGRDFDPEVVEIFRTSVAPHPPGTGVILSDGYCGIVKEVHQGRVNRPIVRLVLDPSGVPIEPKEIDLVEYAELTIISADFDPWARPEAAATSATRP
jgi:HD-GYP domain-containing protein (c-di-GMP phosphodiesterase class II)